MRCTFGTTLQFAIFSKAGPRNPFSRANSAHAKHAPDGGDVPTSREYEFARARGRNVTLSGVCFVRAELARENVFRGPTRVACYYLHSSILRLRLLPSS